MVPTAVTFPWSMHLTDNWDSYRQEQKPGDSYHQEQKPGNVPTAPPDLLWQLPVGKYGREDCYKIMLTLHMLAPRGPDVETVGMQTEAHTLPAGDPLSHPVPWESWAETTVLPQ